MKFSTIYQRSTDIYTKSQLHGYNSKSGTFFFRFTWTNAREHRAMFLKAIFRSFSKKWNLDRNLSIKYNKHYTSDIRLIFAYYVYSMHLPTFK